MRVLVVEDEAKLGALLARGLRCSQVAYEAGFADQSHLNRWFRRIFGVSPGAYQQAMLRHAVQEESAPARGMAGPALAATC